MALIGCCWRWLRGSPPLAASVGRRGFAALAATASAASPAAAAAPVAASRPLAWMPPAGVTIEQSLQRPDYFQLDSLVSKRQLMELRVHLGHKAGCRSEWMTPHLFGCRCGVDIIDLEQTAPMLRRALNFTAHVAARGGIVLFFWQGWPALAPVIERHVRDLGEFAYTRPWVDQALTDASNYFDTAARLPDLAVFLSCMSPVMLPHPAIASCAKVMIPSVGICDSNADPRLVTYPVPGNDDSPQAIRLYLALFGEAISRGKAAFAQWTADAPAAAGAGDSFRQAQHRTLQEEEEVLHQQPYQHQQRHAAVAPAESPLRLDPPAPAAAPASAKAQRPRQPHLAGLAELRERLKREAEEAASASASSSTSSGHSRRTPRLPPPKR